MAFKPADLLDQKEVLDMDRIIDAANYLYNEYKSISGGELLDEMKLHKLLYLAQRESLALTGEPLFSEEFEGWKFGPVSPAVRDVYTIEGIQAYTKEISPQAAIILNAILEEYGPIESWSLSQMSHNEVSWQNSRKGLGPNDPGNEELKLEDIRQDAKKVRLFDHTWGMYYDEFMDVPHEEVPAV